MDNVTQLKPATRFTDQQHLQSQQQMEFFDHLISYALSDDYDPERRQTSMEYQPEYHAIVERLRGLAGL